MTNHTEPLQQPMGCPPPALARVKPLGEGQPTTQVWGTLSLPPRPDIKHFCLE